MDNARSHTPLLELLDLKSLGEGLFVSPPGKDGRQRVYGGQTAAQALAAASFTVDDEHVCHSVHSRFLRPGQPGRPVDFEVTSLQDAKRFATRLVIGSQRDTPMFQLSASFQLDPGTSPVVHTDAPTAPAADTLPTEEENLAALSDKMPEQARARLQHRWPMELRHVDRAQSLRGWFGEQPQPADQLVWMRMRDRLPEIPNLHRCALAYGIDALLVPSCFMRLPLSLLDETLQIASLDHCLWFHGPFAADEFLLVRTRSNHVSDGRGMTESQVFQAGKLVATVVQEALIHQRP